MIDLALNPSLARQILVSFLRSEVTCVGLSRGRWLVSRAESIRRFPASSPPKRPARGTCWQCGCCTRYHPERVYP